MQIKKEPESSSHGLTWNIIISHAAFFLFRVNRNFDTVDVIQGDVIFIAFTDQLQRYE